MLANFAKSRRVSKLANMKIRDVLVFTMSNDDFIHLVYSHLNIFFCLLDSIK